MAFGSLDSSLAKAIQIALGRGVVILFSAKGLQRTERLGLASEDEVADRPSAKILHFGCELCAHTDTGAELLVGGLQSRGNIDGVAVSRVIEETAAAEVGR